MATSKKKMIITLPDAPSPLEEQAIDIYDSTARFAKSHTMLQLLKGAVVLKELGLLDYVIGLGSTKDISSNGDEVKRKVFALLDHEDNLSTERPPVPSAVDLGRSDRHIEQATPRSGANHQSIKIASDSAIQASSPVAESSVITPEKPSESAMQKKPEKPGVIFNRDNGLGGMMSLQTGEPNS